MCLQLELQWLAIEDKVKAHVWPKITATGHPTSQVAVAMVWRPTLAVWLDSTPCPDGCQRVIRKSKKTCNISKIVIAISHPDQWGFWEWLGQNTSVGVSPETFLVLLLQILTRSQGA
jgi:hypothetical protein